MVMYKFAKKVEEAPPPLPSPALGWESYLMIEIIR